MDDKEIRDDENTIEELTDEDIQEYEPGREDPFVSEDEVNVFEVNEEMDDFEDELDQDMDHGATYSTSGEKAGFFSKLFRLPFMPAGWVGVLLVILILLFLFIPRGDRRMDSTVTSIMNQRIGNLEDKIVNLESLTKRIDLLSIDVQNQKQLDKRLDKLEQNLAMLSGQLQKEIADLNKKMTSTPPAGVLKKNDVKQTKTPPAQSVEKPADEQIHIVKKGENLYRIALRYGLTEAQLLELNNLKPKAIIYPGQKLKVSR